MQVIKIMVLYGRREPFRLDVISQVMVLYSIRVSEPELSLVLFRLARGIPGPELVVCAGRKSGLGERWSWGEQSSL